MTAQIATTTQNLRPLAQALRFANIVIDVACTIGALDVIPVAYQVESYQSNLYGAPFTIDVQLDGTDVVAVDRIAAEVPGEWNHRDTEVAGASNYAKRGRVRFGGESVSMLVFTGRPATTDGGAR